MHSGLNVGESKKEEKQKAMAQSRLDRVFSNIKKAQAVDFFPADRFAYRDSAAKKNQSGVADAVAKLNASADSELKPADAKQVKEILATLDNKLELAYNKMVSGEEHANMAKFDAIFNEAQAKLKNAFGADTTLAAKWEAQLKEIHNKKLQEDLSKLNANLEAMHYQNFLSQYRFMNEAKEWQRVSKSPEELDELAKKQKEQDKNGAALSLGSGKKDGEDESIKKLENGLYENKQTGVSVFISDRGVSPVSEYDWHDRISFQKAWAGTLKAAILAGKEPPLQINIKSPDVSPTQLHWLLEVARDNNIDVHVSDESLKNVYTNSITRKKDMLHGSHTEGLGVTGFLKSFVQGNDYTFAQTAALWVDLQKTQKARATERELKAERKQQALASSPERKKAVESKIQESKKIAEKLKEFSSDLSKNGETDQAKLNADLGKDPGNMPKLEKPQMPKEPELPPRPNLEEFRKKDQAELDNEKFKLADAEFKKDFPFSTESEEVKEVKEVKKDFPSADEGKEQKQKMVETKVSQDSKIEQKPQMIEETPEDFQFSSDEARKDYDKQWTDYNRAVRAKERFKDSPEYIKYEQQMKQYNEDFIRLQQWKRDANAYGGKLHPALDADKKAADALVKGQQYVKNQMDLIEIEMKGLFGAGEMKKIGPKGEEQQVRVLSDSDFQRLNELQKRLQDLQKFQNDNLDPAAKRLVERQKVWEPNLQKLDTTPNPEDAKRLGLNENFSRAKLEQDLAAAKGNLEQYQKAKPEAIKAQAELAEKLAQQIEQAKEIREQQQLAQESKKPGGP